MKKTLLAGLGLLSIAAVSQAAVINTSNSAEVSAFQSGATVLDFESVSGRTPLTINGYTSGLPVPAAATIFNEFAGVQFSVGGGVGTNKPALYELGGDLRDDPDASSGDTVLGPVDFDGNTLFGPGALIEVFFPTKVSKVGFWLNPSLGNVVIIAADTNFAFSGLTETTLENYSVGAGNFVGIERASADIGGFKIIGIGATGFTIDDFTFDAGSSTVTPIPEPSTYALLAGGLLLVTWRGRRRAPHRPVAG